MFADPLRLLLLPAAVLTLSLATVSTARADDADKAACESKVEGDARTRGDGDAGTSIVDESDGNALSCDDDAVSRGDDGCTVGLRGAGPPTAAVLLGTLVLVATRRRRRVLHDDFPA